jgi:hypothetical protein
MERIIISGMTPVSSPPVPRFQFFNQLKPDNNCANVKNDGRYKYQYKHSIFGHNNLI